MKTSIISFLKIAMFGLLASAAVLAAAQDSAKTEKAGAQQNAAAETQTAKVNVNTADADSLQELPRIGPVMAQRIIEYRDEHGPFQTVDDLVKVRGIGEKTLERLRPLVSVK